MKNIKRIIAYLLNYKFLIGISLFTSVLIVVAQIALPLFTGKAIDYMVYGNSDFSKILVEIIWLLIFVGISTICQYFNSRVNQSLAYQVASQMRKQAIEKISKLPISYLDSHAQGDILNRIIVDVDTFCDGLLAILGQLFSALISIVATVVVMLYLNIKIGLLIIVLTPLSLFISKFIASHINKYFKAANNKRSKQTAYVNQMVSACKLLKAYDYADTNNEEFAKINNDFDDDNLKSIYFSSLINPATRLINNIVYAFIGLVSCLFALQGSLSVGDISIFLNYASQYGKPFNDISSIIAELSNGINCANRVFELLDQKEEEHPYSAGELVAQGKISIEQISFGYTKEKLLFKDFSLEVKPGEHVAIVGATGAGKSSLINLLMLFYRINSGSIRFDDVDINNIDVHSLRNNIGMVLQDSWLFSGTIKENIAYGKPKASDQQIIEAAKKARAHSFIMRLPNGYDSMVSENGDNLADGEKQLLCIARVFLKEPKILILDEATSSIDTRSEMKVVEAINELMVGKTAFIVAHRLSTIKDADVILVMENGDIVESGSHQELMAKKGVYYQLLLSQFNNKKI